jgi:hypothetical protein
VLHDVESGNIIAHISIDEDDDSEDQSFVWASLAADGEHIIVWNESSASILHLRTGKLAFGPFKITGLSFDGPQFFNHLFKTNADLSYNGTQLLVPEDPKSEEWARWSSDLW